MGGLTMQDYLKFEVLNHKREGLIIIQKFLQKKWPRRII